jgi:peptide/nickel transport system permease protein
MSEGEAYLDIVWRQFKKNRAAYLSLWVMIALFLIAIFAPLLASNVPLIYRTPEGTIYPWLNSLFNPEQRVDFVFNMALIGFFPWIATALIGNMIAKRKGVPGRRRLGIAIADAGAMLGVLVILLSIPGVRPNDRYSWRDFPQEEFQSHGAAKGTYALVPFGPTEQDNRSRIQPPGYRKDENEISRSNQYFPHIFGTADAGEDVLARMIYGTRISMTVGIVSVGLYVSIGVVLGALAGYFGGAVDMFISRVIEIVILFPVFFLILTIVGLIGPSIFVIMVVIGLTSWPGIARLTRGEVLKQRSLDYTLAAQALGTSHRRIVFRHILPNSLSPALVTVPFGIAGAIIIEAGLSLLGFGVPPPAPSWGQLLHVAQGNYDLWWLIVVPSIAIFVTVTTFNLVGNGLRDALDPRLRI